MTSSPAANIGSSSIWRETLPQLVERWLDRPANAQRTHPMAPEEIAQRVLRRVETVSDTIPNLNATVIRTAREWETRWNARTLTTALVELLEKLGWKVTIPADSRVLPSDLPAFHPEDENVILLDRRAAKERARRLQDAGLLLLVRAEDAMVLLLAEELYEVLATKLGHTPADWVEELAMPLFVQRLLGLPFNPIVPSLLPPHGT